MTYRKKSYAETVCPICGRTFIPSRARIYTCSTACTGKLSRELLRVLDVYPEVSLLGAEQRRLAAALYHLKVTWVCAYCGQRLTGEKRLWQRFCGKKCARGWFGAQHHGRPVPADKAAEAEAMTETASTPDASDTCDEEVEEPQAVGHLCHGWIDARERRHPCPDAVMTTQYRCQACWKRTWAATGCDEISDAVQEYLL